MNRQQRRKAERDSAKAGRPEPLIPVEEFRVRDGAVACSIDIAGLDPSTIQIRADKLTDVVAGMDRLFSGWTYQKVLSLFASAYREWMRGNTQAGNACLAIFWLALRHPESGDKMRTAISHTLRRDGRAHVTFHAGAERGIAFAIAPQFCGLSESLEVSKSIGGIVVEAERDAEMMQ